MDLCPCSLLLILQVDSIKTINVDETISREYQGAEDYIHEAGSIGEVYGYLDKLFPGRQLDDMMRLTTLMRYEIAARHLVKESMCEEARAVAPSVVSTSAPSTSNVVPRRYFNEQQRALLKDVFKVDINNGKVSKVAVRALLKMRPALVLALAPGEDTPSQILVDKVFEAVKAYARTMRKKKEQMD